MYVGWIGEHAAGRPHEYTARTVPETIHSGSWSGFTIVLLFCHYRGYQWVEIWYWRYLGGILHSTRTGCCILAALNTAHHSRDTVCHREGRRHPRALDPLWSYCWLHSWIIIWRNCELNMTFGHCNFHSYHCWLGARPDIPEMSPFLKTLLKCKQNYVLSWQGFDRIL